MLQMLLQGQYLNRRTISEKFHAQKIRKTTSGLNNNQFSIIYVLSLRTINVRIKPSYGWYPY